MSISVIYRSKCVFRKPFHEGGLIITTETHQVLSENQFGFRQDMSTENALARLVTTLYSITYKGKKKCVFLDLAKAFDTLDHAILK